MPTLVDNVTVSLRFVSAGGDEHAEDFCFDPAIYGESDVEDQADAILEELGEEWEYEGYAVINYDRDYPQPSECGDLDDYHDYVEMVEQHGEAYALRYADIGDNDFESDYRGCYGCVEDYARELSDELGDVPSHLVMYIDWEAYARDLMMDCSTYEGSEGVHIFVD